MRAGRILLLVAAFAMALGPTGATLADPGKGRGKDGRGGHRSAPDWEDFAIGTVVGAAVTAAVLGADERDTILRYFKRNPLGNAGLPPGIAKNLARGKPLPPGIAKKALPSALLAQLPRRDGYDYLLIGATVVLVSVATGLVLDALDVI